MEIKTKLAIAKSRFTQMYKVLTSRHISLELRHRLLVCYVFSVILYGCETWTLTKPLMDRIEACEMWFMRKMGNISYKQRITNEEVLRKLGTQRSLLKSIKTRKLRFFGHTKRHNTIMKDILEGKMEGRRPKGRPRAQWSDNIKQWTGRSLAVCSRLAENREEWRRFSSQPLGREGT